MPWPPFDGARIRILATLRHLARRHAVTLAAPVRSQRDAEGAARLGALVERVVTAELPGGPAATARRAVAGALRGWPAIQSAHWSPALAARLRDLTASMPFEIAQIEFSIFAPYRRALDPAGPARTVLSMHNVETLRFERELRECAVPIGRRLALSCDRLVAAGWEARAVRAFDAVTVVSDLERRWVERVAGAAPVAVVPNGVDTEHFQPQAAAAGPPRLVFTGALDYPPNVDAVTWFVHAVWPALRRRRPDLGLDLVGRRPAARVRALDGRDGVRVTGEVPDVRPYLGVAAAVVVPLRAGGGTRLKILEALAMARPVVSTPLGAEGLEVTDGVDILLAADAEQFARAVLDVLACPERAARLGAAGRRLAVTRYDWARCLEPLDALYERVLAAPALGVRRAAGARS